MSWVWVALLSPAVYSIVNFVDKYILSRHIKDYRGISMYSAVMAVIFGSFFWYFGGQPILSSRDSILIITSGVFTFWAMVLYFKALSLEDTSKIIILFQMGPVLILILSYFFLNERINLGQFIGFLLVLSASVGVSVEKKEMRLKLSKSFYLILLNQILWSVGAVIFKFVVDQNSFIKVVSYESWGIALGGIILFAAFPNIRNPFLNTFKTLEKRAVFFVFLNEGIFVIARLLNFAAISMGPLALVSILGSTSVFFGLIYGVILSLVFPSIFKEGLSKQSIIKNVGFGILAFIGICFIY
jgi:drug/metabolite transporter (DMT)-like permease